MKKINLQPRAGDNCTSEEFREGEAMESLLLCPRSRWKVASVREEGGQMENERQVCSTTVLSMQYQPQVARGPPTHRPLKRLGETEKDGKGTKVYRTPTVY